MNETETLAQTVAGNLVALRKAKGLTQQELSDILRYSDKSVSKWERGASLPRIEVMKELADFYGVTVDYLLVPHSDSEAVLTSKQALRKANWIITAAMLFFLAWTLAAIIYGALDAQEIERAWLVFVFAVPCSIAPIVLMIKRYIGKHSGLFLITASVFLWTMLGAFFLYFFEMNLWYIFVSGIPMQIVIYLYTKLQS